MFPYKVSVVQELYLGMSTVKISEYEVQTIRINLLKHPCTQRNLESSASENMLQNVFNNMHRRVEACIEMNGNHFQPYFLRIQIDLCLI